MGSKNYRNNLPLVKAFTLVELMIVVSIIAILATLAIIAFQGQISKGHDATRKADINRIKIAVEEYEKDHNCYPQYVVCGTIPSQPIYPYLNSVPCDPVTNASYVYDYQNSVCPGWYSFYSKLQFTADPNVTPGIGPGNVFNYISGSENAPASGQGVPPSGSVPTSTPHGTIGGGGGNPRSQYYGCRSGSCVPIGWNPNRPGPECDPSFLDSNCYGQCIGGNGQRNLAVECKMI